ncbi:hypothetical protein H8S95_13530 [Pontibacter sp. KCTC 32443]|nr:MULTISPECIES: hypothetical protein [Pontibacter]MBC5775093.1 hypothetical protein [Pontibacter sp. KCTC 32443]
MLLTQYQSLPPKDNYLHIYTFQRQAIVVQYFILANQGWQYILAIL